MIKISFPQERGREKNNDISLHRQIEDSEKDIDQKSNSFVRVSLLCAQFGFIHSLTLFIRRKKATLD